MSAPGWFCTVGSEPGDWLGHRWCHRSVVLRAKRIRLGPATRARQGSAVLFHLFDDRLPGGSVLDFDVPPIGAQFVGVTIRVPIPSPAPGDYAYDPDASVLSLIEVSYQVVPPCSSCGDTTPVNLDDCPPGCSTVCSSLGCEPCEPNPPGHDYLGETWSLSLTSDAVADPSDGGLFTPHGTLTVMLAEEAEDGTFTGNTATLSASF